MMTAQTQAMMITSRTVSVGELSGWAVTQKKEHVLYLQLNTSSADLRFWQANCLRDKLQ